MFEEIIEPCKEELNEQTITYWDRLSEFNDGTTCGHIINVVYRISQDKDFKEMNAEEQNILLYAGFYHDISKKGKPWYEGKDHIHPFMSAMTYLWILK